MAVLDHLEFDQHEAVFFASDRNSRLRAIVALHDTVLGPALGGCRMYPYDCEDIALGEVLRLSQGMTYKNAIAGLPLGGGKAVIFGDPRRDKTEPLLIAYAALVNQLNGRYITAEDLGMSVNDLKFIARHTPFLTGVGDGREPGDPGPPAALGVYHGMRAAVKFALGRDSLFGLTVAIQGLGSVGWALAKRLHAEGARLIVADTDPARSTLAAARFGACVVSTEEIFTTPADVLSPCALGRILNGQSIPRLAAPVICGCANNQLDTRADGERLRRRGILYAPDYVVNAGGVISVAAEYLGTAYPLRALERVERIYQTTLNILTRAQQELLPTSEIADLAAKQILENARYGRKSQNVMDILATVGS